MKRRTAQEKELDDRARLTRAWMQFHREQLAGALVGLHRDVLTRLMAQLKAQRSARELVNFVAAQDWSVVDADTRAIALFEINNAIVTLRERRGLPPFDDPLPGAPPNAFQVIRKILTELPAASRARPTHRGPYPGAITKDE